MNIGDRIRHASPADIRDLVLRMRDADWAEQEFSGSREAMANVLIARERTRIATFCLLDRERRPAALLGAYLAAPRVATLHGFGTDTMPKLSYLRFMTGLFRHCVLEPTVDTASCRVLRTNTAWITALERMGGIAEPAESPHRVVLRWTNPTVDAAAAALASQPSDADRPKEGIAHV